MVWTKDIETRDGGSSLRCRLLHGTATFSYHDVVNNWQKNPGFVDTFIDMLAEAPYEAFYFETPPLSRTTPSGAFEFMLIDSRSLAGVEPDPWVFQEHFGSSDVNSGVAVFPNLGRDAVLVAPCPVEPPRDYAHLAGFSRQAPREQQHALWRRVGEAAEKWLVGEDPVWISTSGLEVFWLHVRLDRYPKYYNHAPYRESGTG
jgi:hypothetical protein